MVYGGEGPIGNYKNVIDIFKYDAINNSCTRVVTGSSKYAAASPTACTVNVDDKDYAVFIGGTTSGNL